MSEHVIAESTSYPASDGAAVTTYLARPAEGGPFPAILMCYEFWGMLEVPGGGPHMRDVAQRFAREGYVAAVPDYYATRSQQPTMEGGVISGGPGDEEAGEDLCEGVRWLQSQPFVRNGPVGVIGWCGGGRQALFLAARCPGIGAAATFYGPPVNRATRTGRRPSTSSPRSTARCSAPTARRIAPSQWRTRASSMRSWCAALCHTRCTTTPPGTPS